MTWKETIVLSYGAFKGSLGLLMTFSTMDKKNTP